MSSVRTRKTTIPPRQPPMSTRQVQSQSGRTVAALQLLAHGYASRLIDRPAYGKPVVQREITVAGAKLTEEQALAAYAVQLTKEFGAAAADQGKMQLILKYLNETNFEADKPEGFVSEVGQLLKQFSDVDLGQFNPSEWAILHRLRAPEGKNFRNFIHNLGLGLDQEEYEAQGTKYDPSRFGDPKNHDWPGNLEWLRRIDGRKVVLTDIPLKKINIFRKFEDDGSRSEYDTLHYANELSAYAREIAGLLAAGYVGLWSSVISLKDRSAPYFIMVPHQMLMDSQNPMVKTIDQNIFVDKDYFARRMDQPRLDEAKSNELLAAFDLAGIPTELIISSEERKDRLAGARKEDDERRARKDVEERKIAEREEAKRAAVEKRQAGAAATSRVDNSEGLTAFLKGQLKEYGCDAKRSNPNGEACAAIVAAAKKGGFVGPEFSKTSLKTFIKYNKSKLFE